MNSSTSLRSQQGARVRTSRTGQIDLPSVRSAARAATTRSVALASSFIVTVPVYTTAGHFTTIGSGLPVSVSSGSAAYVYHTGIEIGVHTWGIGTPTNIGNTVALLCTRSDGASFRSHYGVNLVPSDARLYPVARILLTEPGSYSCVLQIASYSTAAASGMRVGVYPAGDVAYTLRSNRYSIGATWTSSGTPGWGVSPGYTLSYMTRVLSIPRGWSYWTLIADGQVTTCKTADAYPPACAGASALQYSDVYTRIEILPVYADGTKCGTPLYSDWRSARISNARHHMTMLNFRTFSGADLNNPALFPNACPNARISTKVYVGAGNRVLVHGEYTYAHSIAVAS
jgi:hypothetical protein